MPSSPVGLDTNGLAVRAEHARTVRSRQALLFANMTRLQLDRMLAPAKTSGIGDTVWVFGCSSRSLRPLILLGCLKRGCKTNAYLENQWLVIVGYLLLIFG